MNEVANKSPSTMLAVGGGAFLLLAGYFLVRDLALPPEVVLLAAAILVSIAAVLGYPRRWPEAGPGALLALAVAGGGWYFAVKSPALLPALASMAVGSIVAVALRERASLRSPSALADRLAWYAAGTGFLGASAAFCFHFLTRAEDSLALQLVPTIAWLAVGLALLIATRNRSSAPAQVGISLGAIALTKALFYDSTHLQGPLRVTMFAAVGALLLAGARLVAERERA